LSQAKAGAEGAQPRRLGDLGGSQKRWLSDEGSANFGIANGIQSIY
jgi:hypothetical protein